MYGQVIVADSRLGDGRMHMRMIRYERPTLMNAQADVH